MSTLACHRRTTLPPHATLGDLHIIILLFLNHTLSNVFYLFIYLRIFTICSCYHVNFLSTRVMLKSPSPLFLLHLADSAYHSRFTLASSSLNELSFFWISTDVLCISVASVEHITITISLSNKFIFDFMSFPLLQMANTSFFFFLYGYLKTCEKWKIYTIQRETR